MTIRQVYISGALMGARDLAKAKELYVFVARVCSKSGYQPYLPHLNTDPIQNTSISDEQVFFKDYSEMMSSAVVVSYIGEPSLGVGAELSICIAHNIPVIAFNERHQKVSRFVKGMLQTSGSAQQIEYDDYKNLEDQLRASLLQLADT